MSIDIYPAIVTGKTAEHADDWNDESTMNLANGNFCHLADQLGISEMRNSCTGQMKVKTMRIALQSTYRTKYHDRLNALCAKAEILNATHIAFS